MRRITLLCFCLSFFLVGGVMAQDIGDASSTQSTSKKQKRQKTSKNSKVGLATPKDMMELGIHGGYFFVSGDVPQEPGFGGGIHLRKSLDYIFSLRGDLIFGEAKGKNDAVIGAPGFREFSSQYYGASLLGVISLNTVRFDKPFRKVNYYALFGGGGNSFETKYGRNQRQPDQFENVREREIATHVTVGAGVAFRLGSRFNISIEHQATSVFGRRADLLDGYEKDGDVRSPFRDLLNYSRLGLNFNIGSTSKLSEPLYWVNPLDVVLRDIDELKNQAELSLEDSDEDGVLDIIDQELNTPPDVPVDTKGRTLDSDRDGIADYKDLEPYNPPRPGEQVNAQGVIENPINRPTGGVTEDRVREIVGEELEIFKDKYNITENRNNVADWFLPMIHFPSGSYTIKYSDYGTLAGIAKMLKGNNQLRLVVTGFTDQTGEEATNNALSYDRAREVIDHLVVLHGIGRGRMILQWEGQNEALVPSRSSFVNRRVEFKVATSGDVEMDPPPGYELKEIDGY